MNTEIFDLAQRDRLVFRWRDIGWCVVFWVRSESSNVNFSSRDSAIGVNLWEDIEKCGLRYIGGEWTYNNCHEWVLEFLVVDLSIHIDTGEPTAVTRVRMVPPYRVLQSTCLDHDVRFVQTCGYPRQPRRTFSLWLMYSTMYSFASFAALTRVSVPCTGRAKESMITREFPITFPCIKPIIS